MSLINPDLTGIVDGSVGDAADWTTPMNTIINLINGGLDTSNFSNASTNLATVAQGVAWGSYSPSWTNVTVGAGVSEGLYIQIGKLVHYRVGLQWAADTSAASTFIVSLPVTARNYKATLTNSVVPMGTLNLRDDSSGTEYLGIAAFNTTTTVICFAMNTSSTYGSAAPIAQTVPFTWATSDGIYIQGFYEAA